MKRKDAIAALMRGDDLEEVGWKLVGADLPVRGHHIIYFTGTRQLFRSGGCEKLTPALAMAGHTCEAWPKKMQRFNESIDFTENWSKINYPEHYLESYNNGLWDCSHKNEIGSPLYEKGKAFYHERLDPKYLPKLLKCFGRKPEVASLVVVQIYNSLNHRSCRAEAIVLAALDIAPTLVFYTDDSPKREAHIMEMLEMGIDVVEDGTTEPQERVAIIERTLAELYPRYRKRKPKNH